MLKLSDRRLWGFDDVERKVLLDATAGLTELAEVVARANRHEQIEGLWIVSATGHELDDLKSAAAPAQIRRPNSHPSKCGRDLASHQAKPRREAQEARPERRADDGHRYRGRCS